MIFYYYYYSKIDFTILGGPPNESLPFLIPGHSSFR